MKKLTCSTSWCENKVKYHNDSEDSYYCRESAYSKFNSGECTKIGSASAINQIMKLYQNLSDRIRDYAKEEQLELKWKNTLDQLKGFDEEIERIKVELESSLRDGTLKELSKLEEKSLNLKLNLLYI